VWNQQEKITRFYTKYKKSGKSVEGNSSVQGRAGEEGGNRKGDLKSVFDLLSPCERDGEHRRHELGIA